MSKSGIKVITLLSVIAGLLWLSVISYIKFADVNNARLVRRDAQILRERTEFIKANSKGQSELERLENLGEFYWQHRQLDKAEYFFDKEKSLLNKNTTNLRDKYFTLARYYLDYARFEDALACANSALSLDTQQIVGEKTKANLSSDYNVLGLIYYFKARNNENKKAALLQLNTAKEYYEKALQQSPTSEIVKNNLSLLQNSL